MSTGLVICSVCHKEVHQDGLRDSSGKTEWRHCSRFHGWTPICANAHAIYPRHRAEIVGMFCQADGLARESQAAMTDAEGRAARLAEIQQRWPAEMQWTSSNGITPALDIQWLLGTIATQAEEIAQLRGHQAKGLALIKDDGVGRPVTRLVRRREAQLEAELAQLRRDNAGLVESFDRQTDIIEQRAVMAEADLAQLRQEKRDEALRADNSEIALQQELQRIQSVAAGAEREEKPAKNGPALVGRRAKAKRR